MTYTPDGWVAYAALAFIFVYVFWNMVNSAKVNKLIRKVLQHPQEPPQHRGAWDEDEPPPTIRDWDPQKDTQAP